MLLYQFRSAVSLVREAVNFGMVRDLSEDV